MHSRVSLVPYLVIIALASGCPAKPILAYAGACSTTWACGTNAASMGDRLVFHELDLDGSRNDVGIKFVSFAHANGAPMDLQVDRHRIIGDAAGTMYQGKDLIGAILVLENRNRERFDVKIADVGEIDWWVGPTSGAGEGVPTYTFQYRPQSKPDQFFSLCKGQEVSSEWTNRHIATEIALVFTGDRYDARKKEVTAITPATTVTPVVPAPGGRWFNIACAGTALAKMHLLRHTTAGSAPTYSTNQDDRQAMLKMLTDDICGTGHSFTRDGEAVFYVDHRDWYPVPPFDPNKARSIEAIWSKDGAICLNEPRREMEDGPGVRLAVAGECTANKKPDPPPCETIVTKWSFANWMTVVANWADWKQKGYGLSANP